MSSQESENISSSLSLVFPANNSFQTVKQSRAIDQPWYFYLLLLCSFCLVDIINSCLFLSLSLFVLLFLPPKMYCFVIKNIDDLKSYTKNIQCTDFNEERKTKNTL